MESGGEPYKTVLYVQCNAFSVQKEVSISHELLIPVSNLCL